MSGGMERCMDIHIHILPGVDDGAMDEKEAEDMLSLAATQKIKTLIATPHYYPGDKTYDKEKVEMAYQWLKEKADEKKIDLYLGGENYYHSSLVEDLENGRAKSLADSNYVLIEFHPGCTYHKLSEAVRSLVEGGYHPVLAHIERYKVLEGDKENRDELKKMGARFQINAGSVLGGFFDERAKECIRMVKNGEIDYIASDAHNTNSRTIKIEDAVRQLQKKKVPEKILKKIFIENPEKILSDS